MKILCFPHLCSSWERTRVRFLWEKSRVSPAVGWVRARDVKSLGEGQTNHPSVFGRVKGSRFLSFLFSIVCFYLSFCFCFVSFIAPRSRIHLVIFPPPRSTPWPNLHTKLHKFSPIADGHLHPKIHHQPPAMAP